MEGKRNHIIAEIRHHVWNNFPDAIRGCGRTDIPDGHGGVDILLGKTQAIYLKASVRPWLARLEEMIDRLEPQMDE